MKPGTPTTICTDPKSKGTVPMDMGGNYAGWTYFCSHIAHKDAINVLKSEDSASSLALGIFSSSLLLIF